MSDKNTTEITLLDRHYMIACPPDEQESLLRAARYLNTKMLEIRRGGKILSMERLAIMAALNITHELLQQDTSEQSNQARLLRMKQTLDEALEQELPAPVQKTS